MRRIICLILGLIFLSVLPVSATSFVLVSDETLVDHAAAVVEGRVVARSPSPAEGMPSTDYLVEVDRLVKGSIPGSTLVVRAPGGVQPDGLRLVIFGAPRFEAGDRALLFLNPNQDGTFRVLHLMMGAFHEVEHRGKRLLVRTLSEAQQVHVPGEDPERRERYRGPRELGAFIEWIHDRARGHVRTPDYFVEIDPTEARRLAERFTFFTGAGGLRMRWFDFDRGESVPFLVSNRDQPGLSSAQVRRATERGIAAWNGVRGANINYVFGGATGSSAGFQRFDGINAILFNDPNGNSNFEDGPFSCSQGGVIAVGGPWIDDARTGVFDGRRHLRILGADIITNKGLGCFFNGSPNEDAVAAELFGHELGHTLGFGHSSESNPETNKVLREALMYFLIHDDGRGPRLNNDDVGAARTLYGDGSVGDVPAAPTELVGEVLSATEVRLSWRDNADNENSFRIEQRIEGGSFQEVLGVISANTTSQRIEGLMPTTTYTFRVRARNGAGFSAYSNRATVTTREAPPDSPANLKALPISETQVQLTWDDRSGNEQEFRVEMASPTSNGFQPAGVAGIGDEELTVSGLLPDTPYTFRVRASNDTGLSSYSNEASATTRGATGPCVADGRTLCLLSGRFEVRVQWRNQRIEGDHGVGHAVALSDSDVSGLFWFFSSDNIELIVKMIDGRSLNDFFWSFYGGLSDVEYWISVRDTDNGESLTYHNPPGEICGQANVRSFPRLDEVPAPSRTTPTSPRAVGGLEHLGSPPVRSVADAMEGTGSCAPASDTLCLVDGRFEVKADWVDPRTEGNSGIGSVVPVETAGGDETGFLWFFSPENIELVVKVIDGRGLNGNFWFFYGALSDVEYTIRVTDTVTDQTRFYTNEPFNLCGRGDLNAFTP